MSATGIVKDPTQDGETPLKRLNEPNNYFLVTETMRASIQ
jgi:hypothetical protein